MLAATPLLERIRQPLVGLKNEAMRFVLRQVVRYSIVLQD